MSETRLIPCPVCDGDGREFYYTHTSWDGDECGYSIICHACGGRGEIEETVIPRTLDDLDEQDSEECHP